MYKKSKFNYTIPYDSAVSVIYLVTALLALNIDLNKYGTYIGRMGKKRSVGWRGGSEESAVFVYKPGGII